MTPPEKRTARILLVDDYQPLISSYIFRITDLLEEQGYQRADIMIDTANNGEEALKKVIAAPSIDLILTDFEMPVMDGFKLYQSLSPELQKKTVFMTGIPHVLKKNLSSLKETDYKHPLVIDKADLIDEINGLLQQYLS